MVPVERKSGDYREPVLKDPPPSVADAGPELEGDAAPEIRSCTVDAGLHQARLDKALVALVPEFSRSHLQGLIDGGHVRVDGVVATTASRRVRAGQRLEVELVPTAESRAFRPEAMELEMLFEDEHLLVIDKPAGLVVHPAPGQLVGHAAQRPAGPSRCGGDAAARRHRASAGQGHLGPDGGRQDACPR